jgi:hypothetical protein
MSQVSGSERPNHAGREGSHSTKPGSERPEGSAEFVPVLSNEWANDGWSLVQDATGAEYFVHKSDPTASRSASSWERTKALQEAKRGLLFGLFRISR